MHIAIVSDYGHINGGAAKVAITSARALAERGQQVLFICAVDPIDPALDHPNIRVEHLGTCDVWTERNPLRAAVRGIWNASAARRVAYLLTTLDPGDSVVHFQQWTKALSPSVIGAVVRVHLRYVFTLHDYFLFCPNGLYFDHARRRTCHRRPLSPSCIVAGCDSKSRAHKVVRVLRQVATETVRGRSGVPLNLIHVSNSARDLARAFFPPDTRHFLVRSPSSLPKLPPVPVRENDTFVFIGRFTPEKAPVDFARAAKAAGIRATFLGAGPELERIRWANPEAEIQPWNGDGAVEALLRRARALVFPSIWQETSGLVVLEALSKGVPVICSHGTGAADWIENGANGFLVQPGDTAALSGYLERLHCNDTLAEQMGWNAYERYWQDAPTTSAYAEHLEACYRAILDNSALDAGETRGVSGAIRVRHLQGLPTRQRHEP
jgi:glycosyltransferase involved in cell wall biosynthesis